MRWPWQREPERRESGGNYSDIIIRLAEAQAAGTAADAASTAAVEAVSGALSRAFASAEVVGRRGLSKPCHRPFSGSWGEIWFDAGRVCT